MFKINVRVALVMIALFVLLSFAAPSSAYAQGPLPRNDRTKGLVYDGLVGNDPQCRGNFRIPTRSQRRHCTHGPDTPPPGYDVARKRAQLSPIATVAYNNIDHSYLNVAAPLATVTCDGDGISGNRVQVLYTHAADVPDGYAAYLASFQQWIAGVDAIFDQSAAQTGGSRHVRFVTDSNCNPVIPDVTLSATGDDSLLNTINELEAMGYNRFDRKYIVFMDARVYCGISTMSYDDSAGSANSNNSGDTFGRIDAGCWSDVIPAHELMHQLGGVQLSAPHSSGESHCYDGYDDMCRPTNGTPVQVICTNTAQGSLFDCGHDDYYSTNPPAGSYLATHWNTAFNQFLIIPQTARVDSLVTGKLQKGVFSLTDTFRGGDTAVVRAHVADQNNVSLSGASVSLTVNLPNSAVQCTILTTTDSSGGAQGSCSIPRKTTLGTWSANTGSVTKTGYSTDTTNSVKSHNFSVK